MNRKQTKAARALHETGASDEEIASTLGVSVAAVAEALRPAPIFAPPGAGPCAGPCAGAAAATRRLADMVHTVSRDVAGIGLGGRRML